MRSSRSIHPVTNDRISFLRPNSTSLCICIVFSVSIPLMDTAVDSVSLLLQILLPRTWEYGYFFPMPTLISWHIYPALGLPGQVVILVLWGASPPFSTMATLIFTIPPTVYEESLFPRPCQHFHLSDKNHSKMCDVVCHCGFNLHFHNN